MKFRIRTSGRFVTSAYIKKENYTIKLFVRDEPHGHFVGNGKTTSTRALAKMLSVGGVNTVTGVVLPPRPFMKQFRQAKTDDIRRVLGSARLLRFKGKSVSDTYLYAGDKILELLVDFIKNGAVTPPNAPSTLAHKVPTQPLIDEGGLISCLDVEVNRA